MSAAATLSNTKNRERYRKGDGTYKTYEPNKVRCELFDHRKRLGLSQEDLDKALGLSPGTIFRIEDGVNVRMETALKIAQFFDLSVHAIWSLNQKTTNDK